MWVGGNVCVCTHVRAHLAEMIRIYFVPALYKVLVLARTNFLESTRDACKAVIHVFIMG